MSRAERLALVERERPALSISRQCRLLAISRSAVYRRPAEVGEADRAIMALMDRQYLARPYQGARRMAARLAIQGYVVNRKRVRRLMRLMGLAAIYQRPNTSKAAVAHKVYPYLLGGIAIERVNQVWCSDLIYIPIIPMAKGFLYLVVVMDRVSRTVLTWPLSNTLDRQRLSFLRCQFLDPVFEAFLCDARIDKLPELPRQTVQSGLLVAQLQTGAPVDHLIGVNHLVDGDLLNGCGLVLVEPR